jgi:hypothetical protein
MKYYGEVQNDMTNSNTIKTNDSGIQVLSGFAYQILTFVYYMTKLEPESQIEFETVEDIAIKDKTTSLFIDKHSESFRSIIKNAGNYTAIQVKRTTLSKKTKFKILYNWLILENVTQNVEKYVLCVDENYNNKDDLFQITYQEIMKNFNTSILKANSLEYQAKKIYENLPHDLKSAYERIQQKYHFESQKDINTLIYNEYREIFHYGGINLRTYEERIVEFTKVITSEIFMAIQKKQPYICTHNQMMTFIEDICSRISDTKFEPDFENFNKMNCISLNEPKIINSREYIQLKACTGLDRIIILQLTYMLYYESIHYHCLLNNKQHLVNNIEKKANDNFWITVDNLIQNKEDTPNRRLYNTQNADNSSTSNKETKYGVCIYLTKDSIDGDMRISWEANNDKE